jgi:hypothetical protein
VHVSSHGQKQLDRNGHAINARDGSSVNYELAMADLHSERLRGMADALDEVRGCLKAAIGWKGLSEGGRRDLLLRALRNADEATQTLVELDTPIDLTEGTA